MSGRNCCFNQCSQSDYVPKLKVKENWKLYTITTRKDEFNTRWRNDLISIVKKYRSLDKAFYERLANGKVYICQKHFAPNDLEVNSKFDYLYILSF